MWALGVLRGSKRHGLLKSQEKDRDEDYWSREWRRETWTPGVLGEAIDMNSWSLKRGGQEAWTLGISKGSESHGLMESQEKLGTWTLGVFERKRETWTAEVTKESWCCGLLESREGDRDMDSWSLSRGRKRRGLLESQKEVGDMDPWSLGREREAWTHGVSRGGAGGMDSWSL